MPLTNDEVRHIARLARLGIDDDEVARLREQLSTILEHFEVLSGFDTEGVPPTAQSFNLANVEREDEPRESVSRDEVFLNAPRSEGPYLRVRAVLE